jgi:excisionase family DNA binding protein
MSIATGARSRLISTAEAATMLHVSRRTVTKWINEDRVPYVRLPGGEYRLPLVALLRSLGGTYDLAADLRSLEDDASGVSEEEIVAGLAARG